MAPLIVFAIFTVIYVCFLLWIHRGLSGSIARPGQFEPEPISVIIAARNEAANLPRLLSSLSLLEAPDSDYEIIIVNDHSTDESSAILAPWDGEYKIKIIEFHSSIPGLLGKKAALQMGIEHARYDVLAFTDADCLVPSTWLKEIQAVMSPEIDYLLGYSLILRTEADTDIRQVNFERSVYYALAAAGMYFRKPFTSSACNMVYRKSVFQASGGFASIGHILSGDDDLLLIKMMPKIRKAVYNPNPAMQIRSI
ncbi:MAG TPA: glycosyltransferase, partial [Candidatus Cloacimonadota bacterium]|nr:glycosyltransferase [Candidatus Cloacimonadota bacterium]